MKSNDQFNGFITLLGRTSKVIKLRPTEVLTAEVEMFPADKVLYFNQENSYTGFVYNYV